MTADQVDVIVTVLFGDGAAAWVLGLWWVAVVITVLNTLMLRHRIRLEDGAQHP